MTINVEVITCGQEEDIVTKNSKISNRKIEQEHTDLRGNPR